MDPKKLEEFTKKYVDSLPDEEIVYEQEIPKDVKVWKDYKNNQKKVGITYICPKCGRRKTIRSKHRVGPSTCGLCPRCKGAFMEVEYV